MMRFNMSPVLQRIGLASLLCNVPFHWVLSQYSSLIEMFFFTGKQHWPQVHGAVVSGEHPGDLVGEGHGDSFGLLPKNTVKMIWWYHLLLEIINKHQDLVGWQDNGPPCQIVAIQLDSQCMPLINCYHEEGMIALSVNLQRMQESVPSCIKEDSLLHALFLGIYRETSINSCWKIINSMKGPRCSTWNLLVF